MSEEKKIEPTEPKVEENAEALTEEELESADGGQRKGRGGGTYMKTSGDPSGKAGRYT